MGCKLSLQRLLNSCAPLCDANRVRIDANNSSLCRQRFLYCRVSRCAFVVALFPAVIFISQANLCINYVGLHPSRLSRAGLHQGSRAEAQPEEEAGKHVLMRNELQRVISVLPPQLWILSHNKFTFTTHTTDRFGVRFRKATPHWVVHARKASTSLHGSLAYQKLLSRLDGRSKTSKNKAAGERVGEKLYYVIIAPGSFSEVKLFFF